MNISRHAEARLQQRGISSAKIDVVLRHGAIVACGYPHSSCAIRQSKSVNELVPNQMASGHDSFLSAMALAARWPTYIHMFLG